jgi:hypothetical protein
VVATDGLGAGPRHDESMTESLQCLTAIAAVNCTLQAARGRFERCPGASCPFWVDDECLFDDTKRELLARPHTAEHLLELLDELATIRDAHGDAQVRSQFNRLLNEEQESGPA